MRGRLKRSGAACISLNEREVTLAQVFADLKLRPLSATREQEVRGTLGALIGRWTYQIDDFHQPENKLQVRDVKATLNSLSRMCKVIQRIFSCTGDELSGLCDTQEEGSVILLAEMMGKNPHIGGILSARRFMGDFKNRADTIDHACRMVVHELNVTKGRPGAPPFDWYREFTELMCAIAVENGITPAVITNRRTHEPQGRFFTLVEKFELLLPKKMRCPSKVARARRLSRALKSLRPK